MLSESLGLDVWDRLFQGKNLQGLPLSIRDGRFDLSGLILPDPEVIRRFTFQKYGVQERAPGAIIKKSKWEGLDFTGSQLKGISFFDSEITNCVFDGCDCQKWRLWGTSVTKSRFHSADLRDAALGGVNEGKRNAFREVDFTKTDLRRSAHGAAQFTDCLFRNARLDKVNFGGDAFVRCVFEGELKEVCFNRHGFKMETLPPNEMTGVDFTRAQLRSVEFRRLDLADVRFPTDENHLIVRDYAQKLEQLVQMLRARGDGTSKAIAAYLGVYQKWAGPRQRQGVLNKKDLREIGCDDALLKQIEDLVNK